MKNIVINKIIAFTLLLLCGCSDFDDSSLRDRIEGSKERLEQLKSKAAEINKQISDLSSLTNGNVITSVSKDSEGKYVLTYKDNKDEEHTVILATMSDIIDVPIIGVKLDENGAYYWTKTVDGQTTWLIDEQGDKFPVSGYTPTISVDEGGFWTVDGEQILDSNSKPIEAHTDASSVFKAAEIDADGNFHLTLGDGSEVTLPVFNSLNLKLNALPVTMVSDPSKTVSVEYELSGAAKDNAVVALAKAEGVTAVLNKDKKTISVSFDPTFSKGTVIVMAYDLKENVIIKPLFFKTPGAGTISISSAAELVAFAAAVNAGGEEAAAKVILTKDVDMSGITDWTPIGNGTYTTVNVITGPTFKGSFDGQGHAVKNLVITIPANAASGATYGLFGILEGATVKQLILGAGSSISSTSTSMTSVGAIAGYAYESVVEKCENHAEIHVAGGADNIRESVGGIVGGTCAKSEETYIKECTNYGKISSTNIANTKNGGTGFSVAGIVGFADAAADTNYTNIVNCVNEGAIEAQATRTAGIVASMNKCVKAEGCVNNATVTCTDVVASNSRVAGIVSGMGAFTYLTNCINNGDIVFAVSGDTTHGYAAGIAGQTNDNNATFDGCENYGAVLSDVVNAAANKYIGIVCANTNKKSVTIRNCKIGGKIGAYTAGTAGATAITADNFASYIYFSLAGTAPTLENNTFSGGAETTPGISTVADLLAFRDAINAGTSIAQWQNIDGEVLLLNDLDMSSVTDWTPIGNATFTWISNAMTISGNAYTGVFNGQDHKLKNFRMTAKNAAADGVYGLFGVLQGATVKNLVVDASSSLTVSVTASADCGVIAGAAYDSSVENCTNYAPMTLSGVCNSANKRVTMAMVGFLFTKDNSSNLNNLINRGAIVAAAGGNTTNGGTANHCAGICGFATNDANSVVSNRISYCDNYGNMQSATARTSGIVAAANRYTAISHCTNYGNQINSFATVGAGRLGNITCFMNARSTMSYCVNKGNLVSTTAARCGGLVSLPGDAYASFEACANYGEVATDDVNRGVFFGYNSMASTWVNCIAGGKVGVYNNGTTLYDSYSEVEQVKYLGFQTTPKAVLSNITYTIGAADGEGPAEITPTLRILFIGNSFTKDAVEHLPGMLDAAGIKSVKMTHMYYGGRTVSEYTTGYATVKDYTCYKCNTGTSAWAAYSGYTIKEIVESEKWDIVSIQEHTGRECAWVWNTTEKEAIEGLITHIKAGQAAHNPKFVYIMSQAYFDMSKLGAQNGRFLSQNQMYQTIVTQAQKVLAETSIEQVIPTGTVLQNLRSSSLNNAMDLTRDGYHMDYGISRYAAGCAVFEMLISPSFDNTKLDANTYRYGNNNTTSGSYSTPVTDSNAPVALQAARYAMTTPFAVTSMTK